MLYCAPSSQVYGFAQGRAAKNMKCQASSPATGFVAYITGENFVPALFANRKSEWLPMATHVVLAAYLFATRIVGVARPDDMPTDKEPPPRSRSWIYAFRSGYFLGAILHSTPMQPPMVRLCNPRCLSWQRTFLP
ncbi:DUF6766 family protein [Phyllobacterium chamaecytisi]|uniref:DUF6766 family protein n=1 Tax=Phyllobacterium chamaecytisi TaxID=2876082 RepID=UPI00351D3B54